jgi:hypothetical protein
MATEHLDTWESLIGTRKSPLKQASIIGLDTFFQVATRSITLEDLVAKVSGRIGIMGRAIIWPHAEPCMDVDKPHQLELLRADLASRQRKPVVKRAKPETKKAKPLAKRKTKTTKAVKEVGAMDAAKTEPEPNVKLRRR